MCVDLPSLTKLQMPRLPPGGHEINFEYDRPYTRHLCNELLLFRFVQVDHKGISRVPTCINEVNGVRTLSINCFASFKSLAITSSTPMHTGGR